MNPDLESEASLDFRLRIVRDLWDREGKRHLAYAQIMPWSARLAHYRCRTSDSSVTPGGSRVPSQLGAHDPEGAKEIA